MSVSLISLIQAQILAAHTFLTFNIPEYALLNKLLNHSRCLHFTEQEFPLTALKDRQASPLFPSCAPRPSSPVLSAGAPGALWEGWLGGALPERFPDWARGQLPC